MRALASAYFAVSLIYRSQNTQKGGSQGSIHYEPIFPCPSIVPSLSSICGK